MSGLLGRYRSERLPMPLLVTVSILLAGAARAGDGWRAVQDLPTDAALALVLFTQCRILDDVADRHRDATFHPDRVLVRAPSIRPIAAAGLALAIGTIALLVVRTTWSADSTSGPAAIAWPISRYVLLILGLMAYYSVRRDRCLAGDHLLLAKYPAFVWIIAASRAAAAGASGQLPLSMLATYLTACVYEALHDHESPAAAWPTLVAAESALLALTLVVLSFRGSV